MKRLDTLVDDIDDLFEKGHKPVPEAVKALGQEIAELVSKSLGRPLEEPRAKSLRMSNLGKPDRQLWYEIKSDHPPEELLGSTLRKFLMGDIWESTLLFLAQEAGHSVENKQQEVEVNGVIGHTDATIDGVVVDVKSASSYAFKKFKYGTLEEDDPFGYYDQLGGYCHALDKSGAWLAVDKQTANLAVLEVPLEELKALDTPGRIDHMRSVLDSEEPPERCYEPVEDGKSGNLILSTGCSYCPFKFDCWKDSNDGQGIRTFSYSTGPKHYVHVAKEPRVLEINVFPTK